MDDIEQDLEEFANYVLEAIKQSEGDKSNWDEILRKWKLIEKRKILNREKIKISDSMNSFKQTINR